MEIQFTTLNNGIRLIKLIGNLDRIGTGEIEKIFTGYCVGYDVRVIVDLSEVRFLASVGLRLLTLTAKSVARYNGRMALINPNPEVKAVLEKTGIPEIIPIYFYLESAETVLLAF